MKKKYKQLGQEQRYQIGVLIDSGKSKSEIAELIGVHKSTIGREFDRNIGQRGRHGGKYVPRLAHGKTTLRHKTKNKSVKFTEILKQQAAIWLRNEQLSPELIEVEWKCMGIVGVTHEYIYQWIWECKKSNRKADMAYKDLYRFLRHGRRRFKRGN